ncbi:hypothetical protein BJ912DRAFT_1144870 [Pholiota molesta]|nr:hypothetical protein BJ912DRAFT_1144870 [Pholiota molesta]
MADSEGRLVYKGFEAWIEARNLNVVGEKCLPHFGVECKESTREIAAWIPSEAGVRFVVCYRKNGQDNRAYVAKLYLDGHKIDSVHHSGRRLLAIKKTSSVEISPTEVREFIFNPVMLTDDDAYVDHASSAGIGEIKLVLQPVEVTKRLPSRDYSGKKLPETPKIHESSKKGLLHQIQFSECKTRPYCAMQLSSSEKKKVGSPTTFIFKYRSLDLLQANGIAPRPTPPAQATEDVGHGAEGSLENSENSILQRGISSVKREDDDDGEEEEDDDDAIIKARALLAELEERRNKKRARKELRRSSNKVKKEFASPFQPGEVIDLTETEEIRPKKRVKNEPTSQFALGDVIDLT